MTFPRCPSLKKTLNRTSLPAATSDAPLFYGNVKGLEDKINKLLVKYTTWSIVQGVPQLHFLVLDMTPVHHVDSMGLHFMEDLVFSTRLALQTFLGICV